MRLVNKRSTKLIWTQFAGEVTLFFRFRRASNEQQHVYNERSPSELLM